MVSTSGCSRLAVSSQMPCFVSGKCEQLRSCGRTRAPDTSTYLQPKAVAKLSVGKKFFSGRQLPLERPSSCQRHGVFLVEAAKKKGGKPVNKAKVAREEKEAAIAAAQVAAISAAPYTNPDVFMHSLLLIDSYRRATGKALFNGLDLADSGRALFEAPFVCVSHDGEDDPVFDYGNRAALELFELSWDEFTKLPSRDSAAPENGEQETRNKLLAEALEKGAVEFTDAERYTSTGKLFTIKKGTLWTITSLEGERLGQAAVFSDIEFVKDDSSNGGQGSETERKTESEQQIVYAGANT